MQRYYKTLIVAALALITGALMFLDRTNITSEDVPAVPQNIASAPIAPDVTFGLLDGGHVALHSLAGHKVLLHFWASWCAPCREEFPALLERVSKEDDTILLTVSGDAKTEDAKRFLAAFQRDLKPLLASGKIIIAGDPDHTLIEGVFQTFQYPETILITPDLHMQRKIIGIYK